MSDQTVNWAQVSSAADSNNDFIKKAAIQVSTFAPGGLLLPKQATEFVKLQIVKSQLLQRCNTQIIPTSEYEIDKLGFTGQVLLPDEEDIAFAQSDLSTPETAKTTYSSKRYKAELALSYDTIKRQILGNNLMPYLLAQFAEAAQRDLEIAAIRGDTSLAPTSKINRLLRKQDGFLKRISANVLDAEGQRLSLDMMDNCQRAMPKEYRYQKGLSYLLSANGPIDYKALVRARATELGDRALSSQDLVMFDGRYPVEGIPLMPDDLTYNAEAVHTNVVFASPEEQFLVGYLEEMSIRTGEDIRAGKFIAVMRFDVAFQIKHDQACVKVQNVRDVE